MQCWSCDNYSDRLLPFSPFPCPLRGGCAAGDPRSRANPRIIATGVGCGEGNAKRKGCVSFLLCSLEQGTWHSSYEQGPSPKGTFCPSPALSPGWKAAGCYNWPQHRLPSLQETGLFFVILLALLPIEQQPTFFKTWSEARPLVFPPGKSLGLMGHTCWVPLQPAAGQTLAARAATQPQDITGTPWALGVFALLQPCGSEIPDDWPKHHYFCPDKIPIRKKGAQDVQ